MRLKLSAFAFKRFWDVHAWSGVVTSLVVYFMFVLGAVVLFYEPLTIWEEPLKQKPMPVGISLQAPLDLAKTLPDEFYYYLPKDGRGPHKIAFYLPDTTSWRMWWLDLEQQRLIPQRELAAAYVYDLHYLWHEVTGYALQYGAGVLVFGFLLAIVTGVLIHLKDLIPQLNQFRPERSRRVVWSDLHKVTGVLGLPFQLVYALTGTLMALAPLLFQISVGPVFGGDELSAVKTAGALIDDPPPRNYGQPAQPLTLDVLTAKALEREPRLMPESFVFRGFRRELGTVDVRGPVAGVPFGDGVVRVRAVDGVVELVQTPDNESAVGKAARWIHGLHTVEYGGLAARLLLFCLAVSGCLAILTGNWVWLERRHARAPSRENLFLARLTAGVGSSAVFSLAMMFMVSRLMPLDWAPRTRVEELTLVIGFAGCVAFALLTRDSTRVWWTVLGTAGAMVLTLPLAALHHSQAGLIGSGHGEPHVVGVEIGFLCIGSALVGAALSIRARARSRTARDSMPADLSPRPVS